MIEVLGNVLVMGGLVGFAWLINKVNERNKLK